MLTDTARRKNLEATAAAITAAVATLGRHRGEPVTIALAEIRCAMYTIARAQIPAARRAFLLREAAQVMRTLADALERPATEQTLAASAGLRALEGIAGFMAP